MDAYDDKEKEVFYMLSRYKAYVAQLDHSTRADKIRDDIPSKTVNNKGGSVKDETRAPTDEA